MIVFSFQRCSVVRRLAVAPLTRADSGPSKAMSSLVNRPETAWKPTTASSPSTDSAPSGLWPGACAVPPVPRR